MSDELLLKNLLKKEEQDDLLNILLADELW